MPQDVKANPDPFDFQDLFMTTHLVRSLTARHPNDAELGKAVRKLITNKYGVISDKDLRKEIDKELGN